MAQKDQNMSDSSNARNESVSPGGKPKISSETVPPDSVPVSSGGTSKISSDSVQPNSVPPRDGSITPPSHGDHEEFSKEKSPVRQLFAADNLNTETGDGGSDSGSGSGSGGIPTGSGGSGGSACGILVSGSPNRGLKRARESGDSDLLHCYLCNRVFHCKQGLSGHMKSHKDRAWRGINPPPVFSRNEFTDLFVEINRNAEQRKRQLVTERPEVRGGRMRKQRIGHGFLI